MTASTTTAVPLERIFHSLIGTWRLKRQITSILPGFPSGLFEGTAQFKPRPPTAHSVAAELLYTEQGELRTDNGFVLRAHRKYIYRYTAAVAGEEETGDDGKISAWFVSEASKELDGREEVDALFHDLEMAPAKTPDGGGGGGGGGERRAGHAWAGRGEHLCSLDMYWAYYEFRLLDGGGGAGQSESGIAAPRMNVFGVRYKVKGPQKDYTSDAAYERIDADENTSC